MNCHCGTTLTPHDAEFGVKKGALHCFACGCCYLPDGVTHREGVPLCAQAEVPEPSASVPAEPQPEPPAITSGRRSRGGS